MSFDELQLFSDSKPDLVSVSIARNYFWRSFEKLAKFFFSKNLIEVWY